MESTDLTCAQCSATWKLIKAGADRVVCPYCKAPVELAVPSPPIDSKPVEPSPAPTEQQQETAPAAPSTPLAQLTPVTPVAPPPESPAEEPSIPETVRTFNVPDTDDPGLVDDYDDQVDPRRRRRGTNPVLKTILILMLLIFLLPIALFIVLLAVCAIMLAAR